MICTTYSLHHTTYEQLSFEHRNICINSNYLLYHTTTWYEHAIYITSNDNSIQDYIHSSWFIVSYPHAMSFRTTNYSNTYHGRRQSQSPHPNMNDIRPIPTLCKCTFPNRVTLSHSKPIKLGRVPESTQHDEVRVKVISEESIRVGRSGRQCDHRIGPV